MLDSKFENQLTYIKSSNDVKSFHTFKIIEMVYNEDKHHVEVHDIYDFSHPKYHA